MALATVMALNFAALRFVVFRGSRVPAGRQFAEFAASTLGFRCAEYIGFLALHTGLGLHYLATIVLVSAVSVVAKFFFYRTAVFRGRTGVS